VKLGIFLRLTLGYLFVFAVIGSMSVYAFVSLNHANQNAGNAIIRDEKLLDQKKKLVDSILVQMSFEKKFAITGERTFRDRLDAASMDFESLLREALASSSDSFKLREYVATVAQHFQSYRTLESEELGSKRLTDKNPDQSPREALVDEILNELKGLESATHSDIRENLEEMRDSGDSARILNTVIWIGALCLLVGTAFLTTRSVTKPVSVLLAKTREVANGTFTADLKIGSPPELAQLARSFNAMCEKLEAAEKMKASFLSVMSHELRTPLTSIKEGIGLLQDGAGGTTTDKQNRLLTILSQETTRMISLVSSLLDLSKMQQGMMEYYFKDERISPLVEQVMRELAPLAEAKKIVVQADFTPVDPLLRIDRERMLQAIRNLVGNALKFTPAGGTVTAGLHPVDGGMELSISDTGPGIPKESLNTIFEEFRQLPRAYPSGAQGSGLGLAIVKEIIVAHGGRVWAESKPESGSVLIFVLPLQSVSC
jgi:two-component system, NtrC family, sensor histidine kinase GlrK